MKRASCLMLLLLGAMSPVAGQGGAAVAQQTPAADAADRQTKQSGSRSRRAVIRRRAAVDETAVDESSDVSLDGPWRAVSMAYKAKRSSGDEVKQLLFVFSDKTVAVRIGRKLIAKTPYSADTKAKPRSIDIPFEGEKTLGIFRIGKTTLRIHANEPQKGRPAGFDADCDVELVLQRADLNWNYVHVMDADGSNQRVLVTHPELTGVGSPEWSRDGKKLAYDAWHRIYGEHARYARCVVCNADGSDLKVLGTAAMPSWSPDARRIAFSSYSPPGVWTMNADGKDRKVIDSDGWAIEWCPVGDKVAYTVHDSPAYYSGSGGANIRLRDLKTDKIRDLLDDRYSHVFYGMAWSPDGRWICFLGRLQDRSNQLAIVHVEGYKKGFRVLVPTEKTKGTRAATNPSWSPDGKQVLAALRMPKKRTWKLYTIDIDDPHEIKRLPGQREDRSYGSPAWSPDGKKIIFCGRKMP